MKKKILIGIAMLLTNLLNAQDNKMWLSGTGSFSSESGENDYMQTTGTFGPSFGYCLNPKMAVGIGVGFTSQKTEEEIGIGDTETKTTEFYVAPFFRYYKPLVENKAALYGELNIAFGSGKSEFDNGFSDSEDTYGFFQVKIAPGIQYWLSESWSVNAEWGALRYRADNDKADEDGEDDQKTNTIAVGLDLSSLSIGLNYHFCKRK